MSSHTSKYKDTVALPETDFPMRGDLAVREPEILAEWEAIDLYGKIQLARAEAPLWVLHDGPPYSNGHIHYGHILNKILKDIIVKSHAMLGYRAPYVPGWDTHGLPIELAVERELGGKRHAMSAADVRRACRDYALKFVEIQRREFRRLGVLGDWNKPYLTLDATYEGAIVRALAMFTRRGYLYRGHKPVSWCPRDRTALAEAEIEYEDHVSPSVYVRFPLVEGYLGQPASLVIWTTTPWTLPANLAIVANPTFAYVGIPHRGELLIVAKSLAESVAKACGLGLENPGSAGVRSTPEVGVRSLIENVVEITPAQVKALEGTRYRHPFVDPSRLPQAIASCADAAYRLYFADYVTADAGTGLVHTAPGHGADDYKTGVARGLPPYAPLDDRARYTDGVALEGGAQRIELTGKTTDEANPIIVAHLASTGYLLNPPTDKLTHKYQHCWRCKNPIVYRATPQWFLALDHEQLRQRALDCVDRTTWVPPWGRDRIHGMIANRPDWVLSRQRLWGTPIPVFYCSACNAEHADADAMEHVARIFDAEGADAWWTRSVSELLPPGTTCRKCGAGSDKFERERDIVDVWFESGVSWSAMAARSGDAADYRDIDPPPHSLVPRQGLPPLQGLPRVARVVGSAAHPGTAGVFDMYLEGSDQHRGWFHSSLLVALGVIGRAPYKQVITHGFVLDEHGKEYSKSAIEKAKAEGRNVSYIEPDTIIKKSGAEMFRLWVASVEFRGDMPFSHTILYGNDGKGGLAEWYRKLRNTARFLLGNLKGFDPDRCDRGTVELAVDRYLLARLDEFVVRARRAYEAYELHVVHRLLVEFVTVDLSALYSDVTKDRLYSDAIDSPTRRGAQVVMYECLRAVATIGAPILSFTCEDIWKHMPKRHGDPESVHMALFPTGQPASPEFMNDFAILLSWRERVTKQLEAFRAQKHKSVDAAVTLAAPATDRAVLARHAGELADLFIVSSVEVVDGDSTVTVAPHSGPRCERCWKHFDRLAADPNDVCERCASALAARKS